MPTIKEAIATGSDRYKANSPLCPEGVVLHSVGTPQPSAEVFVKMWRENRSQYFTHYVLDDRDVYKIMPHDRKCYHIGSPGNSKWLGIEMCEPRQIKYTSGATFTVTDKAAAQAFATACYENAVWLLAELCQEYGWDPQKAILTHNEVTRKKLSSTDHVDPEHLWKGLGLSYSLQTLRDDVAAKMGTAKPSAPAGLLYRVQVGAFSKKTYAEKKLEAVKAEGFDAFLAAGADQLWRVQVGAFRVREYAEAMLANLKEAGFSGFLTTTGTATTPTASVAPKKTIDEIAQEVIRGQWGSGSERKKRLEAAGYSYKAVQNHVNQLLK